MFESNIQAKLNEVYNKRDCNFQIGRQNNLKYYELHGQQEEHSKRQSNIARTYMSRSCIFSIEKKA